MEASGSVTQLTARIEQIGLLFQFKQAYIILYSNQFTIASFNSLQPKKKKKLIKYLCFFKEWNGVVNGICQEEKKKRRKMDIKLECEDANFAFPEGAQHSETTKLSNSRNGAQNAPARGATVAGVNGSVNRVVGVTRPRPHLGVVPKKPQPVHQGPITLTSQLSKLFIYLFGQPLC